MPTIQANGITLYYEEHGSGDPLLLIGGLGTDLTLFTWLTPRLARHHRVIAFDNRGAGRSDKPDVPYTIAMLASDAIGVLDALAVGRADLLGVSMGGKIALELALSHPARVGRMVIVGTSAAARTGPLTISAPMRIAGVLERLGLIRSRYPQPQYAFLRQREASGRFDVTGRLGEIAVPTLIAHGRKDRSVPLERAEQLHAGIAGSRLVVFGGGHMFFVFAERQALLDQIEGFLRPAADERGQEPA